MGFKPDEEALACKLNTEKRVIVMSTPERGTKHQDGKSPPFDVPIMDRLRDMQRFENGELNYSMAFDRAGSSTSHPDDMKKGEWWRTEGGIKSTFWFYGCAFKATSSCLPLFGSG